MNLVFKFFVILVVWTTMLVGRVHGFRGGRKPRYETNMTFVNLTCPDVPDQPACPTHGGGGRKPGRGWDMDADFHFDDDDDDDVERIWVCHNHSGWAISKCIPANRALESDTCGCCDGVCKSDDDYKNKRPGGCKEPETPNFVNLTCPDVPDQPACPTYNGRGGPYDDWDMDFYDDDFDDDDGQRIWVCHNHSNGWAVSKCIHPTRALESDTCGCCNGVCENQWDNKPGRGAGGPGRGGKKPGWPGKKPGCGGDRDDWNFVNLTGLCPDVPDQPACPTLGGGGGRPGSVRGNRVDWNFGRGNIDWDFGGDDDDVERIWVCHNHSGKAISKCINPERALESDTCGCCDGVCDSLPGKQPVEDCDCSCGFFNQRVRIFSTGDDGVETEQCVPKIAARLSVSRGAARCVEECL